MNNEKYHMDDEEKEILEFFESNILASESDSTNTEKTDAIADAKQFLKKSERINIRMNAFDLNHIKRKAAQEGIPYQTLISSMVLYNQKELITDQISAVRYF